MDTTIVTLQELIAGKMSLINIIITIGVGSVCVGLIYIGKKLQILDDLKATTNKIKSNLKVVSDHLTRNSLAFDAAELQSYSPLNLTPAGVEFIKSINFDKVFETNKDDFFRCIDSENPKLKYDVEILAIKAIATLYEKEYMNFLKILFYNQPKRNIENTSPTLGVYVRDKYLEAHPEIVE